MTAPSPLPRSETPGPEMKKRPRSRAAFSSPQKHGAQQEIRKPRQSRNTNLFQQIKHGHDIPHYHSTNCRRAAHAESDKGTRWTLTAASRFQALPNMQPPPAFRTTETNVWDRPVNPFHGSAPIWRSRPCGIPQAAPELPRGVCPIGAAHARSIASCLPRFPAPRRRRR